MVDQANTSQNPNPTPTPSGVRSAIGKEGRQDGERKHAEGISPVRAPSQPVWTPSLPVQAQSFAPVQKESARLTGKEASPRQTELSAVQPVSERAISSGSKQDLIQAASSDMKATAGTSSIPTASIKEASDDGVVNATQSDSKQTQRSIEAQNSFVRAQSPLDVARGMIAPVQQGGASLAAFEEPAPARSIPQVGDAAVTSDEQGIVELPELSDEAIAFLTSSYYAKATEETAKRFELSVDDLSFLNEMDHLVLGKSLTVAEYVEALRGEFPQMEAKKKEDLIALLVAERLAPWGDTLQPSAQTVAREAKLQLPSVPYYAVYAKPLTFGGAASEVAHMADIPLAEGIRERLRDLIVSKVKGIRIDAQIEEQLARPIEFGGLGLSKDKARSAVDAMADVLKRARVMTEEEYSSWLAEDMRAKQAPASGPGATSPATVSLTDEDGAEIAAITSRMARPVRDTASVLALSTETLLKRLALRPTDPYLAQRLENIVNTRLRDVRSRMDVLMKLERDVKVGGMGLERAEAERIADQIEEGYREFHNLIAEEEKETLKQQLQDQDRKIEQRKKREAEEHARWFEEKVKAKRAEEENQKNLVERMRVIAQGFTTPIQIHPIDAKEEKREKAAFGPLVPAPGNLTPVAKSTATAPHEKGRQKEGIAPQPANTTPETVTRPPDAPFTAPHVAKDKDVSGKGGTASRRPSPLDQLPPQAKSTFAPVVKVSAETAKAATAAQDARPKVEDVRVVRPRLSGPLQELGDLSLATFRRMGKSPAEATSRVLQKIELLGQESFERRVEGIRAWQASPLQKAYVSLVAEAFSTGTPVHALVEKKRGAGQDVPSNDEIAAIVDLNGRLRL